MNFLMFKLVLEKAEGPETKLSTSAGSSKKQENPRKTSISATLKLLKKTNIELPKIIALTANSYTGIKEKYKEDGFDDFLAKPISVKELNKIIYTKCWCSDGHRTNA